MELQRHETRDVRSSPTKIWQPVRPEVGGKLSDVRQQVHHAAQFGAAAGFSYLEPQPENAHISLEWIPSLRGLFSRVVPARTMFRVGVIPADLRYTLKRDYEIPRHDVAIGEAFDGSDKPHLEELERWMANGASMLSSIARPIQHAGEVQCSPNHFDISMRMQATHDRTIRVGLELGDDYYDEPFLYVSMTPQPASAQARSRPLWGRGTWHTLEWVGAVLPGSRLKGASKQERQVREFIDSAVSASRGLAVED